MAKPPKKRLHWRPGNQPEAGHPGAGHPPGAGAERSARPAAAGSGNGARDGELPPGGWAGDKQPVRGKAKGMAAGPFSSVPAPQPFRHAVFGSEAEYDQSVANVVARIKSGQVKARTPDE